MCSHFGLGRPAAVLCLLLATSAAQAELVFRAPTVDIGQIRAGAPLAHRFEFVNRGPESVEIVGIHVECGCLTPKLAQETYGPGETGEITLEISTLTQSSGPHAWDLDVAYRTENRDGKAKLTLRASVVTEITVEPAAVVVFADGPAGHEVLLTDLRPKALEIGGIHTSSTQIKARVTERFRDAKGHEVRRIRFDVAEDYPVGRRSELIEIVTDDPAYRELKVPLTIIKRSRGRVAAMPDEVCMRRSPGQPIPSRMILLRDARQEPVVVDTARSEDPSVACQWARGPGAMATLKIRIDASRLGPSGLKTLVHVRVSKPEVQEITIPVGCTPP